MHDVRDEAFHARIQCIGCVLRHVNRSARLRGMKTTAAAPNESQVTPPNLGRPLKWALGGLSLSILLSSLGTSIANVALPTFAQSFGATFQAVQWVVIAYLLAVTSLIVSVGRLGDLFGRRRLLLTGILIFSVSSVFCGLAPTLDLLIAARAIQGLGAAAMMALTIAFVGEIVPEARTGRAMGLLGTMSAIGTALGPSLGGLLVAASGWRSIFLIHVPLGFAAALLIHRHLPKDRQSTGGSKREFDAAGTALLALALGAYALAMTTGRGQFGAVNIALVAIAIGSGGLFVFIESKVAAPLVRLTVLRDRALRGGLMSSGLVSTVMMTTLVVGPFYLSRALGLKSAVVGVVMSLGPLLSALTGVPAGRLADRWGANRMTVLGLIGIATGATILTLLPANLGIGGYIAPIVITTVGYALFQTANNTGVMRNISPDQRGVVSGLLNLSRSLGLITGASVMGAVFAFASGAADITSAEPAAVATGMRMTFGVAALLAAVALVATARNRNDHSPSA